MRRADRTLSHPGERDSSSEQFDHPGKILVKCHFCNTARHPHSYLNAGNKGKYFPLCPYTLVSAQRSKNHWNLQLRSDDPQGKKGWWSHEGVWEVHWVKFRGGGGNAPMLWAPPIPSSLARWVSPVWCALHDVHFRLLESVWPSDQRYTHTFSFPR